MKSIFTLATAALMMLCANAQTMNGSHAKNVTEPELLFHTAAPGLIVMPRIDMSQMMMVYDVTPIPREGQAVIRWGRLNEHGEGESLWTKWREFDDVISFSKPGRYVIETHAEGIGKENSTSLKATFKVDYLGMTLAPGMTITPTGERGTTSRSHHPTTIPSTTAGNTMIM